MATGDFGLAMLAQLATLVLFVAVGAVVNRLLPTPMLNGASLYSWLLGCSMLVFMALHIAAPQVSSAQAVMAFLAMGMLLVLARWWARRAARQMREAEARHG